MCDPPKAKKPKLEGATFLELKEKLRRKKKILIAIPRLQLLPAGLSASLSINPKDDDRIPIFLSDVQNLLMYSIAGTSSPYVPERWCKVEKFNRISHTVVLIVEGLHLNHYKANEKILHTLKSCMDHKLELVTPATFNGSIAGEIIAVPLTGAHRKSLIKCYGSLEAAVESKNHSTDTEDLPDSDKFSRTELILSPMQLIEEGYPIPSKGGLAKMYDGFEFTKEEYAEVNSRSPMFGLDCEMCKTTQCILELTHISIIDEHLNVVYETLVKPPHEIIDYLTEYSGITEDMMENVTTTLKGVQESIKKILPADAILVGQSLDSDLQALKMMHPYVIDTSVIFNTTGDRYRKSKLEVLSQTFLNERIQDSKNGHCFRQDSVTSMKLVKLKLSNTPDFGDLVLVPHSSQQILASSIFKQTNKEEPKSAVIAGNPLIISEYSKVLKGSTLKMTNDENFQQDDLLRLVVKDTNKEVIKRYLEVMTEHALNFCHIRLTKEELDEENIVKTLKSVNKWVKKIWNQVTNHGLVCVIFSGTNDPENGACFLSIKKNTSNDLIDKLESEFNKFKSSQAPIPMTLID
ncbi:unnamed protein product [Trichogramma brassicae]|uniref:Exonuclease domain-containing protein n=1 Tax=Trichogramma brassicae TaxID=86971 RepID=A0A6H5I9P6_9HYME|nr:unnamed protein product [Trichogramma brassicae]